MSSKALKTAATGKPPADPQEDQSYAGFKHKMELSKAQFLPLFGNSQRNVDAFLTVVYNAVAAEPDLLICDRRSLFLACMKSAQDGLLPDKREAVLNVYNTKVSRNPDKWAKVVQYLPMVRGLIKKLRQIPGVRSVDAAAVYRGEPFKYQRGDDPRIEHEPRGDGTFDDIVAAYVVVTYEDGTKEREVMFRRDLDKARAASKTPDSGPWVTWYDQMAIKSVVHRIYKRMPHSAEVDAAFASDAESSGWNVASSSTPATEMMGAPREGAPGLTFGNTGDGVMEGEPAREREKVHVDQSTGEIEKTASKAKAEPEAETTSNGGPIGGESGGFVLTFADVLARIKAAQDREEASVALDLARHLDEKAQADLQAAVSSKFPAPK